MSCSALSWLAQTGSTGRCTRGAGEARRQHWGDAHAPGFLGFLRTGLSEDVTDARDRWVFRVNLAGNTSGLGYGGNRLIGGLSWLHTVGWVLRRGFDREALGRGTVAETVLFVVVSVGCFLFVCPLCLIVLFLFVCNVC